MVFMSKIKKHFDDINATLQIFSTVTILIAIRTMYVKPWWRSNICLQINALAYDFIYVPTLGFVETAPLFMCAFWENQSKLLDLYCRGLVPILKMVGQVYVYKSVL